MTSDRVQSKLDRLKVNFERLDELAQIPAEAFGADFRNVAAATYLLQTSVQALIDIGGYLVAQHALATPRTSQEVFERLEEAELVRPGTAAKMANIIGFRNRVVHLYDRVDEHRVHQILTEHRSDLPGVLHQLLSAMQG